MLTFFVFMITLVFIRAPNLDIVSSIYERMLAFESGAKVDIAKFSLLTAGVFVLVASLLCSKNLWPRVARRLPAPVLGLSYTVVFALALMYTPPAGKVFIYFQF
jgi:alginate O-acetyltransferase complex protein AlgI